MSQYDYGTIDTAETDGVDLAQMLELFRGAMHSMHSGASAPSYATEGLLWLDKSAAPWKIKFNDGTDNIVLGEINPTANTFHPYFNTQIAGALAGKNTIDSAALVGDGVLTGAKLVNATIVGGKVASNTLEPAHLKAAEAANFRNVLGLGTSGASPGDVLMVLSGGGVAFQPVAGFKTGYMISTFDDTLDDGFLWMRGETIGAVSSGADLESASYQALFEFLWNKLSNAWAPVAAGRGASAAADWAAGKTIKIPSRCGRSGIGAGQGDGLLENWAVGETGGEEKHTLLSSELTPHGHTIPATAGGTSSYATVTQGTTPQAGSSSTASSGGGQAFNVIHPVIAENWIIKI